MLMKTLGWWRMAAVAACALAGCVNKQKQQQDVVHFLPERDHEVSAIEYRVGIPDVIAISAPRVLEIDGEEQPVRPDGKINLKLVGDVKVAGMTAKEISAKLEVLLSKYYVEPKVNVRVTSYQSKKYYVYGQAAIPGPKPFTGRDTVVDAVARAGTNPLHSWTSHVRVIRPSHGDGPPRIVELDVREMMTKGDWSRNVLLEPNDIVYIPPTPGSWIAQKVRGVLLPVAPVAQAYMTPAYIEGMGDAYDDDETRFYYAPPAFNTNGY
jgi:polysaccharide export outer membrane protein